MDASVFTCPNCGYPVDVDFKTRKGTCPACDSRVTFPRSKFNNAERAQTGLKLAMRCFRERRLQDAKDHADDVLAVAIDNTPALFIRAYYEAYAAVNRNSERMTSFFSELSEIQPDADEAYNLSKLFLISVNKLDVYAEQVLEWAMKSLPNPDLLQFADEFAPYTVLKSTTIDFFTPRLVDILKKIAVVCSIPKTCYALISAIEKHPDSPYPENRFFLKTKTLRFFNDFVLPTGEIVGAMGTPELRDKFMRVYLTKKKAYENQMKGGIK